MPHRTLAAVLGMTLLLAAPQAAAETPPAASEPEWAPISTATIRPGVQISTQSGGCTTNFIFYEREVDAEGNVTFDVFIGLAAHCFTLGGSTGTNGCVTPTRPLGSRATVSGASHPATLVYSSWVAMQEGDESDPNTCSKNDFGIVKLDERDEAKVNPTLQFYGGPDGLRTSPTEQGTGVFSYGNSSLRLGVSLLSPKRGYSTGTTNAGWSHGVYTVSPGIPGDSGSAMVDADGKALGVVVTLGLFPPGINGVTDMAHALDYLRQATGRDVRLATGTQPFQDRILP